MLRILFAAMIFSSSAMADECYKVGQSLYTIENRPVIVAEAHCSSNGDHTYKVREAPIYFELRTVRHADLRKSR
ncbi:hypothetical protein ACWX0K_20290 [Nitrobacteraceae bacterium UC4446_H13]